MNTTLSLARLALGRLLTAKGDAASAKVQLDILRKQWSRADPDFLPAKALEQIAK